MILMPGCLCCGTPTPCGSELAPTPCPASVSAYDCPTFWVEVGSEAFARKATVSVDLNGATLSLLCGTVRVEDPNGNSLLSATSWNQLPQSILVAENIDKVKVIVENFGVKDNPFAQCGAWNPSTPAPLVEVSCPTTSCGVGFEHDRLEVTVTAAAMTAIYDGSPVNAFDPSCPASGRIERRLDGLVDYDGVYELTLISEGPISSSEYSRVWQYDYPAFGCYAAGDNYIKVTAKYNKITDQCRIDYEIRFQHEEQREKHSGTPSAWSYQCSGRGCPTATSCLWYGDVSDAVVSNVGWTFKPDWENTDIPTASTDIAPASLNMNTRPLCDTLNNPATLSRTSLTGSSVVGITLEFFD